MSILGLFCGRGEICRLSAGACREGHRRREGWITLQSDCVLLLLLFFQRREWLVEVPLP